MALNLTSSQAAAVRSALTALNFEQGAIHMDFDPVEVFVSESGWLTVRGGLAGFEEHRDLLSFQSAYGLIDPEPDILALAYEFEALCENLLMHAVEEGNRSEVTVWANRRDRCRAAIAASMASPAPK